MEEVAARPEAPRLPALLPALSVVGVLSVSLLMYRQRLSAGLTNVDDYLYARQTAAFLRSWTTSGVGIADTWREFGVNSPLVPTLAMPLAGGDATPSDLVLVQLPLAVGLTVTLAALLARVGMGRWRWALAGVLSVMPPVLTYTAMLNFSIAATLGVVASLWAYLASQRLRRRQAAVLLGVSLGLLSLSRVVAVVYIAALAIPMVVDLLLDRRDWGARLRNTALTLAVSLLIAAPWWLTAGPTAVSYLLDAGYASDSVFTRERTTLDTLGDRITRTADETGWLLAIGVLVVFVVGVFGAVARARREPSEASRGVLLGAAGCVLGLLLLGTSSNAGTAFALPCVVLMAGLGVAGTSLAIDGRWLPVRLTLSGLVALGLTLSTAMVLHHGDPATWNSRPLWLSGTPARQQFEAALGCDGCTFSDARQVNEDVYRLIGSAPTLILRADAVLNPESLRFFGERADNEVALAAPNGQTLEGDQLQAVSFAIGGRTAAPYFGVDLADADAVLAAAGFCRVLSVDLTPANAVTVWRSGPGGCP